MTLFVLYAFLKYVYSYWARKGFPYIPPTIPTGNMSSLVKREASFGMNIYQLYESTKEPFIGIYLFFRPALLIRDAELARRILTVDFNYFHDRGVHSNERTNPLSGNLFSLPGEKWKNLRTKLTPTFTSGKLKNMFTTLEDVGNAMLEYLRDEIPSGRKTIELRSLTTMYAADVIASTFFGLNINTFKDTNNSFHNLRYKLNQNTFFRTLASSANFLCPKLVDMFHLFLVNKAIAKYMVDLVKDTMEYREQNNVMRKDFMQLLLQLRNTGEVKENGDWTTGSANDGRKSLTIEQCAAQAFIFYIAGLETTAATVSFCLYELAQNEDVKNKLLKDINETLEKHYGEFTYDCIQDMKYLDLCILETIRKYPGLPILNRECTKTYQIPNSEYVIEEGTAVVISLMGLHRDPEYFPDPLKFMPERFLDGQRNYNDVAYFPFGEGPRTCIGLRQGKLSAKVALVKILTSFKVDAVEKHEIEFDNFSVGLIPKDGVNVVLTRIE